MLPPLIPPGIGLSPGSLRTTREGSTLIRPINQPEPIRTARVVLGYSEGSITVTTDTVIPITDTVTDSDNPEISQTLLATLDSSTFTLKRTGWMLVDYSVTFGYASSSGTAGATSKEAKVTVWIEAGGNVMSESLSTRTLSSRLNTSKYVKEPTGEITQSVNLDGITGKTAAFTGPLNVPGGTGGSGEATWTPTNQTVDWDGLDVDGKIAVELDKGQNPSVTSSLTVITEYSAATFQKETVFGKCLIRCVAFDATDNKILLLGTQYPAEVLVKASVVYGGDGTVEPEVVATAATVTIFKLA